MKNVFEAIENAKRLAADKNVSLEIYSDVFDNEHLDANDYPNDTELMTMEYKGFRVFVYIGDWDSFKDCGKWIDYDIYDKDCHRLNDTDNICPTNDVLEAATDIAFYMDKINKYIESATMELRKEAKNMKIAKGYKLFEQRNDGKLFPLFIGKNTETPMNEWIMAEIVEHHPGFSHRPGWHLGVALPSAPWLMGCDGTYKSQRGKKFKRVWCKVEYAADIDYTDEVQKLPKKCFTDRLPDGGFYNFKESGNRLWVIADRIRVAEILSEEERQAILKEANYDEMEAFEPYRQAMAKRMKAN